MSTVPLPWGVGERFCRQFGYSQRWLALGLVPKGIYAPLPADVLNDLNPKLSFYNTVCELTLEFSAFYERLSERVSAPVEALDEVDHGAFEFVGAAGLEPWRGLVNTLTGSLIYDARHCPPKLHRAFFEHMRAAAAKFMAKHEKAIEEYRHLTPPKPGQPSRRTPSPPGDSATT